MCHTLRVAKDSSVDDWATQLVKRVGAAVKEARGGRSAAWLSERTAELGYRISTSVIAKLDSGHRGDVLSVPEWLILAAALDIPPLVLLYPDLPDGQIEMLPDHPSGSWTAYLWTTGEAPSPRSHELTDGEQLVDAARERWDWMRKLPGLEIDAAAVSDELYRESLKMQLAAARQRIHRLEAQIRDSGGKIRDA
jgi:hypothetical protein